MKPSIIVRAIIYMLLAALPVWAAHFASVIEAMKENKSVLDHSSIWFHLSLTSVIQALLVLRVYIDGSAERARSSSPTNTEYKP